MPELELNIEIPEDIHICEAKMRQKVLHFEDEIVKEFCILGTSRRRRKKTFRNRTAVLPDEKLRTVKVEDKTRE